MTVLIPSFRSRLLLPKQLPFVDPRERRFWYCYRQNGTIPFDPLGAGNTQLLSDLGITPVAFHDVRSLKATGATASLADVSGAGTYGPALVQGTPANQPTFDGTYLNFNGAGQCLVGSAMAGLTLSAPVTLAIIAQIPNANGLAGAELAYSGRSVFLSLLLAAGFFVRASCESAGAGAQTTVALVGGNTYLILLSRTAANGTASRVRTPNQTAVTATAPSTAPASGSAILSWGGRSDGTASAAMKFRASLAWQDVPSAGQETTLETYAQTYHQGTAA